MSDLRMKLNTTNDLKVKLKASDKLEMKFDDYQDEKDPIFRNSPAYTITYNDINSWNNKSDFSGNYNDLTNKPNLNIYATFSYVNSGLSNKVEKVEGMGLSQNSFTTEEKNKLATLENYDDTEILEDISNINTALESKANISDVPTLTSDLFNDSGFITKDVDDLTNYPTNSSINAALGGKQNIIDTDNKLSADLVDDTTSANKFVTASEKNTWNNKSDFSGNYNDLTNKPTIPTKTSDLQNDSGFITNSVNDLTNYTLSSSLSSVATSGSYTDLTNTPTIPTKTSDLNNDSGFITKSVNDLTNYTLSSSLSAVATSGSYNDLSNKPTIPTAETLNITSTTETIIGTYDGKPLYSKLIKGTSSVVDSNLDIPHGASNVNNIMLGARSFIKIGSNFFPLNRPANNASNIDKRVIMSNVNSTNITIYVGSYLQSSGYSYSIEINYTKTTD